MCEDFIKILPDLIFTTPVIIRRHYPIMFFFGVGNLNYYTRKSFPSPIMKFLEYFIGV